LMGMLVMPREELQVLELAWLRMEEDMMACSLPPLLLIIAHPALVLLVVV